MARFTFKLPDIGEGIAEAEIVGWHVKVGDRVEEDQNIADMMTDKATVEMESPVSGTVVELAGEVGDQVAIGAMLVVIETEGEVSAEADPAERLGGEDEAEAFEAENPGVEEVVETPSPLGREGRGEGQSEAAGVGASITPDTAPLPASGRGRRQCSLPPPSVRGRKIWGSISPR